TAASCAPNCSPQLDQDPPAPAPPPDPSAESPLPEACAGGPEPSIVALDPEDGIGDIALSPTHVYWSTSDAILRRAKDGGSPEVVAYVEGGAGQLRVAGSTLFWAASGAELFALPLDGPAQPLRLVDDLAAPLAWTASEDRVYYMAQPPGDASGGADDFCTRGYQLKTVPSTGGQPELLAEHQGALDQLAVDATGVYWPEILRCVPPEGKIAKYTFATASVSTFAVATGNPHSLRAAGGRVLWLDEGGLWSSPASAGDPVLLAHPPTIRALATDGTDAYWAASDLDSTWGGAYSVYADVFSAPLAGGEAHEIACHIFGIDEFWFVADRGAVYYRSWIHDLIGRLPTSSDATPHL
ncbi:MAG TPA: hypothetical protein VG963_21950, partial [Polyangiaceae bacterium]|nr:hypothetical protein [Polyangiaceae bacterium]